MSTRRKAVLRTLSFVLYEETGDFIKLKTIQHLFSMSVDDSKGVGKSITTMFEKFPVSYDRETEISGLLYDQHRKPMELISGMFLNPNVICFSLHGLGYNVKTMYNCLREIKQFFKEKKLDPWKDSKSQKKELNKVFVKVLEKRKTPLVIENVAEIHTVTKTEPAKIGFGEKFWNKEKSKMIFSTQMSFNEIFSTIKPQIVVSMKGVASNLTEKDITLSMNTFALNNPETGKRLREMTKFRSVEDFFPSVHPRNISKSEDGTIRAKIHWKITVDGTEMYRANTNRARSVRSLQKEKKNLTEKLEKRDFHIDRIRTQKDNLQGKIKRKDAEIKNLMESEKELKQDILDLKQKEQETEERLKEEKRKLKNKKKAEKRRLKLENDQLLERVKVMEKTILQMKEKSLETENRIEETVKKEVNQKINTEMNERVRERMKEEITQMRKERKKERERERIEREKVREREKSEREREIKLLQRERKEDMDRMENWVNNILSNERRLRYDGAAKIDEAVEILKDASTLLRTNNKYEKVPVTQIQ